MLAGPSAFAGGKDEGKGKDHEKDHEKDHGKDHDHDCDHNGSTTNVYNITNIYAITNISNYNITNITEVSVTNIYNITNGGSGVSGLMWIDHFSLLPGDASVVTSYNAVSNSVGSGLTGLVIESTTTGEDATGGGNKVVHAAVSVPPGFDITGVRVCYELTSASSFISQITLAQVQNPPSQALVILDDPTDLTSVGPICVNSATTVVHPQDGAVLLSFRVNFGSTSDKIVIRGVALSLVPSGTAGGDGV